MTRVKLTRRNIGIPYDRNVGDALAISDGLAGGDGLSGILGSLLIADYDAGNVEVSGANITAAPNQANPGYADLAAAADHPQTGRLVHGFPTFDCTPTDHIDATSVSPLVYSMGTYQSIWCVMQLDSTSSGTPFGASAGALNSGLKFSLSSGVARAHVFHDGALHKAESAFTDTTEPHVFRLRHDASGIELWIDGNQAGTEATASNGLDNNISKVSMGAAANASIGMDGAVLRAVLADETDPSTEAAVDAFLMQLYGIG